MRPADPNYVPYNKSPSFACFRLTIAGLLKSKKVLLLSVGYRWPGAWAQGIEIACRKPLQSMLQQNCANVLLAGNLKHDRSIVA